MASTEREREETHGKSIGVKKIEGSSGPKQRLMLFSFAGISTSLGLKRV